MDIYDILEKFAEKKTGLAKERGSNTVYNYSKARQKKNYNPHVQLWQSYYRGTVIGINTDTGFNGEKEYKIVRNSMRVPKIIAQKWAATLFTEAFKIALKNDGETDKFKELERLTRFRSKIIEAAVWGYSEGTSAIVAGADIQENGNGGKVKLDIIKYDNIYPIVFTKDEISVIAFAKQEIIGKDTVYTISVHSEENGKFLVENIQAKIRREPRQKDDIEFSALDNIIASNYYDSPQYCIIKPNTVNDYTESLPFGQAIFADALAACDDADLAAAGLRRDVKEGDQVTFIGRDLLMENVAGGDKKKIFSNPSGRFFTIPQDLSLQGNDEKKQLYDRVVPEIRVSEFRQALRDALDWATMASGLGKGMLDIQSMATATQVIHSEADKMQSKSLHEQYLEGEIIKLIKAMCELSGMAGNNIDSNKVNIVWEDSVIVDTESAKRLAIAEIDNGVLGKDEYRAKFYGETLGQAKAKIKEIAGEDDDYSMIDSGAEDGDGE